MRKVLIFLCAMMVTLASCGPVTAISPTPMATARPKATNTPVATSTSEPVYAGPSGDASSYQLRTWTEKEFWQFKEEINSLVDGLEGVSYELKPNYITALDKEFLLRFPESKFKHEALGKIAANNPEATQIPGLKHGEDVVGWVIANILGRGFQPDDLETLLSPLHLFVSQSFHMKNLIGNGEDALVIMVQTCESECKSGIFAVISDGEKYHIEKMRDWDYGNWPQIVYEVLDVGDTNGNGLSELLVRKNAYYSGTPPNGYETSDHIEWSRQDARFHVQTFPMFSQMCYFPPEYERERFGDGSCSADLNFFREGSQNKLLTQSYWLTHESCPFLAVQRVSIWDGT